MKAVMKKMVFEGYDEDAISKFHQKQVKSMERQNAKILKARKTNPSAFKGFSVCDPVEFADMMVDMYKHTFKKVASEIVI